MTRAQRSAARTNRLAPSRLVTAHPRNRSEPKTLSLRKLRRAQQLKPTPIRLYQPLDQLRVSHIAPVSVRRTDLVWGHVRTGHRVRARGRRMRIERDVVGYVLVRSAGSFGEWSPRRIFPVGPNIPVGKRRDSAMVRARKSSSDRPWSGRRRVREFLGPEASAKAVACAQRSAATIGTLDAKIAVSQRDAVSR